MSGHKPWSEIRKPIAEDSKDAITHGFGLPPWAMYGGHWTRWQKIAWRIRHPRRAWRVALENWRARGNL